VSQETAYFDAFPDLFDRYTAIYDPDGSGDSWILNFLPPHGAKAVDLGCGAGRHTVILAERYREVLAVDISAGMLNLARDKRARPNIRYEQRSLLDVTPERDGLFDAVVSFATIHHLRATERVLRQVKSLAAPGATLLLADVVRPDEGWRSRDWHLEFARQEAERIRQRTGSDEAAEVAYQLRTHPRWLDHSTTNIPLTREEFKHTYARLFPGAEFEDNHPIICCMRWGAAGA
jgi:SAM-dependent methyltransferase